MCQLCMGVCCSALRELVGGLIDSGELPADCKVSDFVVEFVFNDEF